MKNRIFAVALNSFREMYRDRFFVILVVGVIFFFLISFLLGELSFEEHRRILFDVGISAIHWLNLGICLFIGGSSLRRELDRQTYMTLLSSPLSRLELILGKFLGIYSVAVISTFILGMGLFLLVRAIGSHNHFFVIIIGILSEAAILLALSVLFSLVLSPFVGIFASVGVFLTGQWLESLKFFAEQSKNPLYIQFSEMISWLFPNLYRLNWRSPFVLEEGLANNVVAASLLHGWAWVGIFLFLASLTFERKNLT